MVPQLDVQSLALLIGIFVPILVAFFVHPTAPSWVKTFVNLVATVVLAIVAIWSQNNGHVTGWLVVNTIIVTLVASLSAYRGVWKPLNVQAWTAPSVGVGKSSAVK